MELFDREERENARQRAWGEIAEQNDSGWEAQWVPGTMGFHELCDRSMVLSGQVFDLLVEHPAAVLDPELYALAHAAHNALWQLHRAASIKCVGGEKQRGHE